MGTKWEKYSALGAVWFTVLAIVGIAIQGSPPKPDASAAKIAKFFANHTGAIQTSQLLFGLASVGLLWWFGSLWRQMSRAEGEKPRLAIVAGLGLVWMGIFFLMSNGVLSAVALRNQEVGAGARFFYVLSGVLASTASVGSIVFIAAVSVLTYRTKMFPRYVAYIGFIGALLAVLGLIGAASDAAFFFFVGGLLGFLVFLIFILSISLNLWKQPEAA